MEFSFFRVFIIIINTVVIVNGTANGFLPGGSSTIVRHNIKIHITQNITPRSNKTQHTKLHKQ
jgi:hypothetical protein